MKINPIAGVERANVVFRGFRNNDAVNDTSLGTSALSRRLETRLVRRGYRPTLSMQDQPVPEEGVGTKLDYMA